MRALLALFLVLVLASFGFVACGEGDDGGDEGADTGGTPAGAPDLTRFLMRRARSPVSARGRAPVHFLVRARPSLASRRS